MNQQTYPFAIVIRCVGAIVRKRRSRDIHPLIANMGDSHEVHSNLDCPQGTFNAAVARFLETGGARPEGVKMLGRWHGMNGQGFAFSESVIKRPCIVGSPKGLPYPRCPSRLA